MGKNNKEFRGSVYESYFWLRAWSHHDKVFVFLLILVICCLRKHSSSFVDFSDWLANTMPMVQAAPRPRSYPHFDKFLLRILMDEIMKCSMLLSLLLWQKKNVSQIWICLSQYNLIDACPFVTRRNIVQKEFNNQFVQPDYSAVEFLLSFLVSNQAHETFVFRSGYTCL